MNDSPDTPRQDAPTGERPGERIAKMLARAGVASRREIERMIADGRVKLDGEVLTTPATVLESLRGVTVDDQPVSAPEAARLFAFHKPSGLITAERDLAGRPTIYNALRNALPKDAPRVMPVGRLDLNTEGLLLLTNDGALKRALELPSSGIERTYRARTFGDISQARLEELIEGVEIDGVRYGKIDANMERRTGRNQWIEMTLTEGKNREVRRVLEHLGLQVSRLLRLRYGPVRLGDLPRGMAAEVPGKVVDELLRLLKVAAPEGATPRRSLAPKAAPVAVPAPPTGSGRPARTAGGPARATPRPAAQSERSVAPRRAPAAPAAPANDEVRNAGPAKPGARGDKRRGVPGARHVAPARRGEHTGGATGTRLDHERDGPLIGEKEFRRGAGRLRQPATESDRPAGEGRDAPRPASGKSRTQDRRPGANGGDGPRRPGPHQKGPPRSGASPKGPGQKGPRK